MSVESVLRDEAMQCLAAYFEKGSTIHLDEAIKCLKVLRLYVEPSQTVPEAGR